MTRTVIVGGLYGDHLPSGEWVVTVQNSHVQTHLGRVELPPGESFGPCFPRCTNVGGFRFAGQAHDTTDPACWEWKQLEPPNVPGWYAYAPPCCGVSPLIYKLDGFLLRSNCGPGVGSQGFRYVNAQNIAITGDATYGPFNGLFEYTDLGDNLWIGQAAYDGGGVQVWDGVTLRQYELGDCRFVRANRDGDAVGLAFTKQEGVVLADATMAELRALPPVVLPEPPDPGPEPPEPPDPGPEPPEPEPGPEPPEPTPIPPTGGPMEPFAAAFKAGIYYARVDRHGTTPFPTTEAGPWFPIRFDRTDSSDPDTHFTVSQPEPGNPRLMLKAVGGGFLTADFTEFGGSVCEGFYCSPEALGWGEYQQWSGGTWPSGLEVADMIHTNPLRKGQAAPSLVVERL